MRMRKASFVPFNGVHIALVRSKGFSFDQNIHQIFQLKYSGNNVVRVSGLLSRHQGFLNCRPRWIACKWDEQIRPISNLDINESSHAYNMVHQYRMQGECPVVQHSVHHHHCWWHRGDGNSVQLSFFWFWRKKRSFSVSIWHTCQPWTSPMVVCSKADGWRYLLITWDSKRRYREQIPSLQLGFQFLDWFVGQESDSH